MPLEVLLALCVTKVAATVFSYSSVGARALSDHTCDALVVTAGDTSAALGVITQASLADLLLDRYLRERQLS